MENSGIGSCEKQVVAVGDVFECSWGYDQTNVDFYQITRKTEKTVWARRISAKRSPSGWLQNFVVPTRNDFLEKRHEFDDRHLEIKRRLNYGPYGAYFAVNRFSSAVKWNGDALHETLYH